MFLFQIHTAIQQVGFRRFKRGYKKPLATPIDPAAAIAAAAREHRDPTDPYFAFQWYLVSGTQTHAHKKRRRRDGFVFFLFVDYSIKLRIDIAFVNKKLLFNLKKKKRNQIWKKKKIHSFK